MEYPNSIDEADEKENVEEEKQQTRTYTDIDQSSVNDSALDMQCINQGV